MISVPGSRCEKNRKDQSHTYTIREVIEQSVVNYEELLNKKGDKKVGII